MTGTVVSDCDQCSFYVPLSWTFTGDDGHSRHTISSTDLNARIFVQQPAVPLVASNGGLYWNFAGSGGNTEFCFCVWKSPYQSDEFLNFYRNATNNNSMDYYFLYGQDFYFDFPQTGNLLLGTLTSSDITATPIPATLPLFATGLGALGLLGWRRKRKAASA